MSATNIEGNLVQRLEVLRRERGDTIDVGDVAGVVKGLIESMEEDITGMRNRLGTELRGLIDYIQEAKTDIAALSPREIHDEHIPVVTDELDAVVKHTEEATGAILDAAEELENLAADLPEETVERITGITTKIYEASNFQDITGQRITKVVSTLKHIESKVRLLAEVCGDELTGKPSNRAAEAASAEDGSSPRGPQLPGEGNSQEDIDVLLDSFD